MFTPAEIRAIPFLTLSEKQAAHCLGVGVTTFKYHKKNIMRKEGVKNLPSLVAALAQRGHKFELLRTPQ